MTSRRLTFLGVAVAGAAAGCASPEAERVRGGGPGADLGNRSPVVELHAGSVVYYRTPCVTLPVPCEGPVAVFGSRWTPD